MARHPRKLTYDRDLDLMENLTLSSNNDKMDPETEFRLYQLFINSTHYKTITKWLSFSSQRGD